MNPGDAIIFNQSGIHGGTTQLEGARSILRLHWWSENEINCFLSSYNKKYLTLFNDINCCNT